MTDLLHAGPIPHSLDDVKGGTALGLVDEKHSPLLECLWQVRMLVDKFRRYVALSGV